MQVTKNAAKDSDRVSAKVKVARVNQAASNGSLIGDSVASGWPGCLLILADNPEDAAVIAKAFADSGVIILCSDPTDRTPLQALREGIQTSPMTHDGQPLAAVVAVTLNGQALSNWVAALEEEQIAARIAVIIGDPRRGLMQGAESAEARDWRASATWLEDVLATEQASRKLNRIWISADWLHRDPGAVAAKLQSAAPDDSSRSALPGAADFSVPELPLGLPLALAPLLLAAHAVVSGWAVEGERSEERAVLDQVRRLLDALPPSVLAETEQDGAVELAFWRNAAIVAQTASTGLLRRATRAESEWGRLERADKVCRALEEELAAARHELNARSVAIQSDHDPVVARELLRLQAAVAEQASLAAERQAAIEHLRADRAQKVAGRDRQIEKLSAQLKSLQDQIAVARPQRSVQRSLVSRLAGLTRLLQSKQAGKRAAHLAMLQDTELFDPIWYLSKNADVRAEGLDPTAHYLAFGGPEGRAPSPLFDARAYLAHYPDVRAAGANPLIHYLEHGRLEGREIRTLAQSKRIAAATGRSPTIVSDQAGKGRRRVEDVVANVAARLAGPALPWTARPLEFSVLTQSSIQSAAAPDAVGIAGESARAAQTLLAMMTDTAALAAPTEAVLEAIRYDLCQGRITLADAWFDGPNRARLRFAVAAGHAAATLRIGQPPTGERAPVELGRVVVQTGVLVADIAMVSHLRPLLIEALDAADRVVDALLVPFPSLWRGGLHFAEALARDAAAGPLGAAATLSRMLLAQGGEKAAFGLSRIVFDIDSANGTETGLARDLLNWLIRDLGIAVETKALLADDPGRAAIAAGIQSIGPPVLQRAEAATLTLPAQAVPSLHALFAGQEMEQAGTGAGFLQLDRGSSLPGWRLSSEDWHGLPRGWPIPNHVLLPTDNATGMPSLAGDLAILTPRPSREIQALFPVSARTALPASATAGARLTVLIDCPQGAEDLVPLVVSIDALGFDAECLVVTPNAALTAALAGLGLNLSLRAVAPEGETPLARMRAAARLTDAERVLMLAEDILIHDRRLGEVLMAACGIGPNVVATPRLVTERDDTKHKGLFTATAGWIAARDGAGTTQAWVGNLADLDLPALFPIVAPDLRCAMLPRALLAQTTAIDEIGFAAEVRAAGGTCYALSCVSASAAKARTEAHEGALDQAAGMTLRIERMRP